MCNLYTLEKNPDAVRRLFADLQIPLEFPEGVPNFQPRDVRITEQAPIVKFDRDRSVAQLVERRWSWPGPTGKPVFNMRSDGREFSTISASQSSRAMSSRWSAAAAPVRPRC